MKAELRWMVRLEHHPQGSRFGERPRDALVWAVTPYAGRWRDGRLIGALAPTYFASRAAATAYARREMHRHYGKPKR